MLSMGEPLLYGLTRDTVSLERLPRHVRPLGPQRGHHYLVAVVPESEGPFP